MKLIKISLFTVLLSSFVSVIEAKPVYLYNKNENYPVYEQKQSDLKITASYNPKVRKYFVAAESLDPASGEWVDDFELIDELMKNPQKTFNLFKLNYEKQEKEKQEQKDK